MSYFLSDNILTFNLYFFFLTDKPDLFCKLKAYCMFWFVYAGKQTLRPQENLLFRIDTEHRIENGSGRMWSSSY